MTRNKWFLAVLTVALVVTGAFLLTQRPQKPTSNSTINFVGYESVSVTENDPLVGATAELISSYGQWLQEHPNDSVKDEAMLAYLPFHNQLAGLCRQHKLNIPALKDLKRLQSGTYPALMTPLRTYLRQKGWANEWVVPSEATDRFGQSRTVGLVYLAPISARQTGTVVDSEGKRVTYTVDMVQEVGMSSQDVFRIKAITNDREVTCFLPEFERTVEKVLTACAAKEAADEEELFFQLQWGQVYKEKGREEAREIILNDLVQVSLSHERQHVRDHRWLKAVDKQTGYNARTQQKALAESRGLLMGVAEGKAPIYAFGHILNWETSSGIVQQTAAQIARNLIGEVIVAPEDPDLMGRLIAAQGQLAFHKTKGPYEYCRDHPSDPSPFATFAKREKPRQKALGQKKGP